MATLDDDDDGETVRQRSEDRQTVTNISGAAEESLQQLPSISLQLLANNSEDLSVSICALTRSACDSRLPLREQA